MLLYKCTVTSTLSKEFFLVFIVGSRQGARSSGLCFTAPLQLKSLRGCSIPLIKGLTMKSEDHRAHQNSSHMYYAVFQNSQLGDE